MPDDSDQQTNWPLPKFYFSVDISDVGTGLAYQEVVGLDVETQVIEYRHSDSKVFSTIKMPGIGKSANATLKKGVVANDSKFWACFNAYKMNLIERRTVTIRISVTRPNLPNRALDVLEDSRQGGGATGY